MTEHSNVRETLRKIKEVTFQDNMIKNTIKYIRECLFCQKERSSKRLNIK